MANYVSLVIKAGALLPGRVCGFALGAYRAALNNWAPIDPLQRPGLIFPCSIALIAPAVTLAVSFVLSELFDAIASDLASDSTVAADDH